MHVQVKHNYLFSLNIFLNLIPLSSFLFPHTIILKEHAMFGVESEFQICRVLAQQDSSKLSSATPSLVVLKELCPQNPA